MPRSEAEKRLNERRDAVQAVELLGLDARVEDGFRPDLRLAFPGGRVVGLEHTLIADRGLASGLSHIDRLRDELTTALQEAEINVMVMIRVPPGLGSQLDSRDARRGEVARVAMMVREAKGAVDAGQFVHFEHLDERLDDNEDLFRSRRRGKARELRDLSDRGMLAVTLVGVYPNAMPSVWLSTPFVWSSRRHLIQAAIDAKARKLAGYRETHAEVWLLVVGSAPKIGAAGSIDKHDGEGSFSSPYDRTIFLERYEGAARFLKATPPLEPAAVTPP